MHRTARFRTYLLFLAGALSGCGGGSKLDLVPAGGTVTYKGGPVSNASVSFLPANGPMANGITDAEGKFILKTSNESGAKAGTYKVTVYATTGGGGAMSEVTADPSDPNAYTQAYEQSMAAQQQSPPELAVPKKYTDAVTTPLSYDVKQGEKNQFTIELTD